MKNNYQKIELFSVPLDNISQKDALNKIFCFLQKKSSSIVTTTNVEFIMRAIKDTDFCNILRKHSTLNLIDGNGVLWGYILAKSWAPKQTFFKDIFVTLQLIFFILLYPLIINANKKRYFVNHGSDLALKISERAAKEGKSIFLLGNKLGLDPNSVQKASLELQTRYYNLKIVGTHALDQTEEDSKNAVLAIKKSGADFVFCSLGSPMQEEWLSKNLAKSKAKVGIGLGASLDFIAGVQKRAPLFIRKIGFEWLYRLLRQPKRIKRQKSLILFIYKIFVERIK